MDKESSTQPQKDEGILKEYPRNFLEAFIILIIIQAILDKPIDFVNVFKSSLIIGILISIITYLNKDFRDNVRQGLHYGVSSIIISQFSPFI
jgi:hypothetical protein